MSTALLLSLLKSQHSGPFSALSWSEGQSQRLGHIQSLSTLVTSFSLDESLEDNSSLHRFPSSCGPWAPTVLCITSTLDTNRETDLSSSLAAVSSSSASGLKPWTP